MTAEDTPGGGLTMTVGLRMADDNPQDPSAKKST